MNTPAISLYIAKLPIDFFRWWYLEASVKLLKILRWVLAAFAHLFSFKELFTTFFKPWKNEYREGLVRTSIFIGACIKMMLIIFDVFILGIIFLVEAGVFLLWLTFPLLIMYCLYGAIFA